MSGESEIDALRTLVAALERRVASLEAIGGHACIEDLTTGTCRTVLGATVVVIPSDNYIDRALAGDVSQHQPRGREVSLRTLPPGTQFVMHDDSGEFSGWWPFEVVSAEVSP